MSISLAIEDLKWTMLKGFLALMLLSAVFRLGWAYFERSDAEQAVIDEWQLLCLQSHDSSACDDAVDDAESYCIKDAETYGAGVEFRLDHFTQCINERNEQGVLVDVPEIE